MDSIEVIFLNFLPTVAYVTIGHANLSTQVLHSYHTAISSIYIYYIQNQSLYSAYVDTHDGHHHEAETGFGVNFFCLIIISWYYMLYISRGIGVNIFCLRDF